MVALPAENEHHEPLPLDPLGKRLCLTFPYLWQAIVAANEADPHWQTLTKYPLRPRVLWRLWQDAAQLVGVRFDDQTNYGLIDIDIKSNYHPNQTSDALSLIRAALETIGLYRVILLRSSWSGGLHLYIPLPEAVPTFGLASALEQCLKAQGLTIAPGQLEVFPNCKSYALKGSYSEYNAHRLPLQTRSGSCLLDADLHPTSDQLGCFFEQWDLAAAGQDLKELTAAIAMARHNRRGKRLRQTTEVEAWLHDLRTEMAEGWTGYGQTNHLLKTIACYGVVFEGLQDEELIEFIHTSAIHSPGYWQWCRHQHEIKLKATVWARSAQGYYWRLGAEPQRAGSVYDREGSSNVISFSKNLQRSQEAQQRIRDIVQQLEAEGTLPETPTARARVIAAQGVSLKTLYRHPTLWHPEHFITIQQSGKTPDVEPDLTIPKEKTEPPPGSAEASADEEFYTLEAMMKGVAAEIDSSQVSSELFCSVSGRRGFSASNLVSLQGSQLSLFNFLDPVELERDCQQALLRGNRGWILQRLMVLWSEGHADLIKVLCHWHPDWGIAVEPSGPVEVGSDAR